MVRMKSNKELNIMTTQTSNASRFSPIFVATITPGPVATRTDKNGNKYSYLTGATIAKANKEAKQMTAMAFGKSHNELAGLLRKGRPVEPPVQSDGGAVTSGVLPGPQDATARPHP